MATPLFTYADGSNLYMVSARAFTSKFPVWEANRTMDEEHVSDLEAAIGAPTEIQGPFSVITYPDEENKPQNRVIDGQHRQEVLRRYFGRNPGSDDFEVLVRRYQIKDHAEAVVIFQKINHAKPMVYRGSATERLHEFVSALKRHFIRERGSGVATMIRPSCNRPFLSVEILEKALKGYGLPDRTDLTAVQLVAHAEKMNSFYAENPDRISGTPTRTMYERAVEYEFFLGLDPKCPWLLELRKS